MAVIDFQVKVVKAKCLTSGNNGHRPLPGESGESQVPNLSGNNGGHQLQVKVVKAKCLT